MKCGIFNPFPSELSQLNLTKLMVLSNTDFVEKNILRETKQNIDHFIGFSL